MHGAGFGVFAQTRAKGLGGGQSAAMQLGVSSGQPDKICIRIGGLISEGRKRQDLGPRRAPALQKVRIGEGKRRISRQSDALCRGARQSCRCGRGSGTGSGFDRLQIHILSQEGGIARDGGFQIRVLHRLNKA